MSATRHMTSKLNADKCGFLLHQCSCVREQHAAILQAFSQQSKPMVGKIEHFLRGMGQIQLCPRTEPETYFYIPAWTDSEALQRDWYVIGEDLYQVVTREIEAELKRLNSSSELSVKPAEYSETESTVR